MQRTKIKRPSSTQDKQLWLLVKVGTETDIQEQDLFLVESDPVLKVNFNDL